MDKKQGDKGGIVVVLRKWKEEGREMMEVVHAGEKGREEEKKA